MKINYIFRNSKAGYSINRVFDTVLNNLPSQITAKKIEAPYSGASFKSIFHNLLFFYKYRNDYNHITGDITYVALVLKKKKTIITIHDIVLLNNTRGVKRIIAFLFWYYIPIRRSAITTCISEKTKEDLVRRMKFAKNKIIVVNNPFDPYLTPNSKPFNNKRPRILQIGTKPNKNINRVVAAVEDINCELRIIGELNKSQIVLLNKAKINYSVVSKLTDEQIAEEYKACDIVCFVSTFEGFGMPIIEAQATGKTVITSNISPMNKICSSGGYLVDPYDIESIKKGFVDIITNSDLREKLTLNGLRNSQKYHVSRIASSYLSIYKSMHIR